MCFGPSSSRRLRARERVQQLACIVAVHLDPSPPSAASSPTLAAERPREHSAPTCFNGARPLPLLSGVAYPSVSSESIARHVPAPSRARWPSPEPRPDVPGGTRAHLPRPAINSHPRALPSTSPASTRSTTPPHPSARATGALLLHHCRHGRGPPHPKFARSRAPLPLPPPPEHLPDHGVAPSPFPSSATAP